MFATVAMTDNVIACGGSIIKELTQALCFNKIYMPSLCKFVGCCSLYDMQRYRGCLLFAIFATYFWTRADKRSRAKYNANIYRSRNAANLRSQLAAHTDDKKEEEEEEEEEAEEEIREESK